MQEEGHQPLVDALLQGTTALAIGHAADGAEFAAQLEPLTTLLAYTALTTSKLHTAHSLRTTTHLLLLLSYPLLTHYVLLLTRFAEHIASFEAAATGLAFHAVEVTLTLTP